MLVFKFPSVTSTQDLAEAIYQIINADEFVIVAEEQTKARGRYRREWYSPKGGLWFTYVIKNYNAERIPFLTFRSSLAVRKVLSTFLDVKIRWPNDIVYRKRKIAGILIEGINEGMNSTVFIGIGIDTNVKSLPEELHATSLYLELKREVDNDKILSEIINEIKNYEKISDKEVIDEINKYLSIKDKKVKLVSKNEEKSCLALFVDYYGRLVTECGIFEVEDILRVIEE
ncbi:biotin--[acetyl-CoA-carboxylase] ligase [Sulfurisphaera ohwakuensis]|uniref:Biotin--[acetyl-CoA-carboxylase] ligase n=1 Tax=Sulfurisphaera ohwakuensis TaxID=69656 RepID=A0A650CHI0_SULOH|nr:biotin--[acetyl-CoA-carboxylase] ligase [Sulfurisphaera ohwakuensis]MBB5252301.1 BirA family biotin operon repressor/biotin-[acetyl-CoA-carboxylase] ligase [Sulfurisphaera ohwakuensis]QGR17233.1 biotin--[acetyl-CoA-carboxylase] ligase [Sulfurisphaera ohwakuensis]